MQPHLVFALPRGSETLSGGNIYNQRLLCALATRARFKCEDIDGARARIERGEPGCYFVDSLDLTELARFPRQRPGQRYGLIVHHLPSLEPGVDPASLLLQIEQRALSCCDVFLATSPFTAEVLRQRGYSAERILTVPPAPPASVHPVRTVEPPFSFAVVSNLIPRKSILELLQALDARIQESDRFFVDLAGRSDLEPAYAGACLELVRDSERLGAVVRYLGALPNERVLTLYRGATAFVSAAKMETFGMAIQEARAAGLPILALDGGHVRSHFEHGETGLIFDSIAGLANGVLGLVRAPARLHALFDSSQRLRLNAQYTWQHAADSFLAQLSASLGATG